MCKIEKMITELFQHHQGYLHSKDLQGNRKLQYALSRLVASGEVLQFRRGLYKHPAFATLDNWQEISLIYPKAVLCMHSACAYYTLTTYVPHQVHLAISNKQKLVLTDYPPVKLYFWTETFFSQHITKTDGVRVYTPERTVCDIMKFCLSTDKEIVKEVANAYLERSDRQLEQLLKTASETGVYNRVREIFELLL